MDKDIADYKKDDNLKITLKKISDIKGCLIFELSGKIDSYNPITLQNKVSEVIASNYTKLIFDCNGLKSISSAGVGAFTAFSRLLKPYNGDIVLTGLVENVFNLFRLLGSSQFFEIKPDLTAAISYVRKLDKVDDVSFFPKLISCPTCAGRLKIENSGRFRCAECKTILTVDENARLFLG
ncbi:MAG: anti-sigma F factor antagonist [Treponema sp.]|nr:MAG: anti-sigma F factor antagonist [Treponema sp.]